MRVLFACEYFPPVAPGGAEWSIYYLAQALRRADVDVVIGTVNHGTAPDAPKGVRVEAMPFPFHLAPGQGMHRQGILENPFFHARFARHIQSVCIQHGIDLIHAQSKNSLPAAARASKKLGKPLVLTLRDVGLVCPYGMCYLQEGRADGCSLFKLLTSCSRFLVEHYTPRSLWQQVKVRLLALALWPDTRMKQRCLKEVSRFISPSKGLLESYPPWMLKYRDRFTIIPHLPPPVEGEADPAPARVSLGLDGRRFVLVAGKRSPGKGTPILLEAARRIRSRHPEVLFVLVGKGPHPSQEAPNVRSLSSISHEEVMALMERAQCVVVPSLIPEAYNRVVVEAASRGTPAIASAVGSLPEQIQSGINGLLVSPGDPESLARALDELLSDEGKRRGLGEAARKMAVEEGLTERIVQRHLEIYRELLR